MQPLVLDMPIPHVARRRRGSSCMSVSAVAVDDNRTETGRLRQRWHARCCSFGYGLASLQHLEMQPLRLRAKPP